MYENFDLNKLKMPSQNDIEDTYTSDVNKIYESKEKIEEEKQSKRFSYNPYHQMCGLNPRENTFETETKHLNSEMKKINTNSDDQEKYYKGVLVENRKEIEFQKKINKKDHIKGIFSALNFPVKPTNYKEAFEYSYDKKKNTIDHDFDNHYKKSFMKTYEENKLMHKNILRK